MMKFIFLMFDVGCVFNVSLMFLINLLMVILLFCFFEKLLIFFFFGVNIIFGFVVFLVIIWVNFSFKFVSFFFKDCIFFLVMFGFEFVVVYVYYFL